MYWGELRINWQSLLSASVGIGLGSALSHYTMSLFGPAMIAEFGWSKAQFALLGSMPLFTLLLVPFAGRFVDRVGARTAATVGFIGLPLGFVAFTLMSGHIAEFLAIWVVQHIFGMLTTSLVFCRVVVEKFDRARGIALSLLMTTPPLAGAIAAPLLGRLIDTEGWRAGFLTLAAISIIGGVTAISLMGKSTRARAPEANPAADATPIKKEPILPLLRNPVLLMLLAGMFLVNIPQVVAASQLKLVLLDGGVSAATATWMISLYAIGVIVGRFISGLALDRIAPHLVALAALGLPAIGYVLLASSSMSVGMVVLAISLIGLAQGAEGDLGAYILSRRFDMKHFSFLLSFVTAMIGGGAAVGATLLSLMLHLGYGYKGFLMLCAVSTVIGALLFALTGRARTAREKEPPLGKRLVLEQAVAGEIE